MAPSLPPLNWFRAFEAAARTLSFTAAAQDIGLTQSAVSQQVKALEQRLGVTLFQRQARGLALTDNGRRLLPQVDAALGALAAATGAFVPESSGRLLTIAASVSVTQWVITPALPAFVAAHPGVEIRFVSAVWPDDFGRALADVEIRFGSEKQVGHGAQALRPNRLVALKAAALDGPIADLPLIETVGTSDGWKAWGAAAGVQTRAPAIYVDSYGLALQVAAHGNGVCLVSELLAGHALRSGQFVRAHPATIPANEGYFLSVDPNAPLARQFADWLVDTLSGPA